MRKATKEEAEYMGRVAALGCIIRNQQCGGRVNVHHKTGAGMGKKASNYDTMPLCFNHHDAQTPLPFGHSVHKGTESFELRYATQDEMIAWTQRKLNYQPTKE